MSDSPKISIVTPAYNHSEYALERFRSIANQSMREFEWIVIDDASEDDTYEQFKALGAEDNRLLVMKNSQNRGARETTNECIRWAQGDYIYRAESDDSLEEDALLRLAETLDANPECGVAFGKTLRLWQDGRVEGGRRQGDQAWLADGDEMFGRLCGRNCIGGPSAMFRRSLVEEVGPFGVEPWEVSFDWHFYLRAAMVAGFAYEPAAVAFHRTHPGSLSGRTGRELRVESLERDGYALLANIFSVARTERPELAGLEPMARRSYTERHAVSLYTEALIRGSREAREKIVDLIEAWDKGGTKGWRWRWCVARRLGEHLVRRWSGLR